MFKENINGSSAVFCESYAKNLLLDSYKNSGRAILLRKNINKILCNILLILKYILFSQVVVKGGDIVPQVDIFTILAVFLAIGVIYIIGMLLVVPIKIVIKFIINGIIGAVALFFLNIFGGFIGITIAINPVTALIAGFLGIPGVLLLLFLQYFL